MSLPLKKLVGFGKFVFDLGSGELGCDGRRVEISPRSVVTLRYLIENRDHLVSKEELKLVLWPGVESVEEGSILRQVSFLRKSLDEAAGGKTEFIKNKYGTGWQFVAEVREVSHETPENIQEPELGLPETVGEVLRAEIPAAVTKADSKGKRWTGWWIGLGAAAVLGLVVFGAMVSFQNRGQLVPAVEYRQLTNDGRIKRGPLFTDGKRIYYVDGTVDRIRICSVSVSGGEPAVVLDPADLGSIKSISPDGRFLVYESDERAGRSLWTVPTSGGKPERLVAVSGEVSWSPNGRMVAFSPDHSKVVRFHELPADNLLRIGDWNGGQRADGEVQVGGVVHSIRWSPDGKRVRLTVLTSLAGTADIWEVDVARRTAQKVDWLSAGYDVAGDGSWSADGRNFFYQAGNYFHWDLYAVSEEGRFPVFGHPRPVVLTSGTGNWDSPVALADDSGIAAINHNFRSELVMLDTQSGAWRTVWGGGHDYELSYSNDGEWVAFTHLPEHTIWKCRADGSERTQLTEGDVEAHQAHWSPDGRRIAYMGKTKKGQWRVHVISASGGSAEVLLDAGENQGVPTWSGDGRYVAFGDLLSPDQGPRMAIRLMDVATREVRELEDSRGLWSPRFAPDGRKMAAVTCDSKSIRVHEGPGSGWREIARMTFVDNATWSADGRYVYFNGRETGPRDYGFFRVDVARGKTEKLADLRDFVVAHENWFGVTPDGNLLAARGAVSAEIWALKFQMH